MRSKNGDIVDILTSSSSAGPSRDWFDLVSTRRARNKIRQFFRAHDRERTLKKENNFLKMNSVKQDTCSPAELMTDENVRKLLRRVIIIVVTTCFAALGFGDLAPVGIRNRFTKLISGNKLKALANKQQKKLY